MNKRIPSLLVLAFLPFAAGCDGERDPLLGRWVGTESSAVEMWIEAGDDYEGHGSVYGCDDYGCELCFFDLEGESTEPGRMGADLTFDGSWCSGWVILGVDCGVYEDTLACDFPDGGLITYEKR